MKYQPPRFLKAILALVLALLAAACASTGGRDVSPEELVGARAQQRWDLVLAGDLAAAYGYLSPAQRSAISSLDYQRTLLQTRVRWRAAEFLDASCDGLACDVRLNLHFSVDSPVPGVSSYDLVQVINEQWVRAEDEWWFVPK